MTPPSFSKNDKYYFSIRGRDHSLEETTILQFSNVNTTPIEKRLLLRITETDGNILERVVTREMLVEERGHCHLLSERQGVATEFFLFAIQVCVRFKIFGVLEIR